MPAAGLASQIFSFTSAIRSLIAANSACRATSRRTFSTPRQPAVGRWYRAPGRSGSYVSRTAAPEGHGPSS